MARQPTEPLSPVSPDAPPTASKILEKFQALGNENDQLRQENRHLREELLHRPGHAQNGQHQQTWVQNGKKPATESTASTSLNSIGDIPTIPGFNEWLAELELLTPENGFVSRGLEDLFKKVQSREVRVTRSASSLRQEYSVARVYLVVNTPGQDLSLFEHDRFDLGRSTQETVSLPLELIMRDGESWQDAICRGLQTQVGLLPEWQKQLVSLDQASHLCKVETNYHNEGLPPGFTSTVTVHEVHARVNKRRGLTRARTTDFNFSHNPAYEKLGLPMGRDFVHLDESANVLRVWCWRSREYERNGRMHLFEKYLESHGIDCSKFGVGDNKSFFQFYKEVKEDKASILVEDLDEPKGSPGRLLRIVRMVVVEVFAEVNKCGKKLMEHEQYDVEGHRRTPQQCICKKLLEGDEWETAVSKAVSSRLGIDAEMQEHLFFIDYDEAKHSEETRPSSGFVGITSTYKVTTVRVYVNDPHHSGLECIGLPHGHDFVSKEFMLNEDQPTLHVWTWVSAAGDEKAAKLGGTALLDLNSDLNDVESILAQTIADDNWSDSVGLGTAFKIALEKIQHCVSRLTNLDETMKNVDVSEIVNDSQRRGSDIEAVAGIAQFIEANFTSGKKAHHENPVASTTGLNIAPGELDNFTLERLFSTAPPSARKIMESRNEWSFDFFGLVSECESSHRMLEIYGEVMVAPFCVHAFEADQRTALQFVQQAAEQHHENPYHGPIHAAQVCHSARWLTKAMRIMEKQSAMENTAFMIAALCHDIKHFSRNNTFCVQSEHPLSLLYNNSSVLENFHSSSCLQLLEAVQLMKNVSLKERCLIRSHIVEYILATDMAEHFETLSLFRVRREAAGFSANVLADRRFIARLCLKAGDLGHGCLPWKSHLQWSIRVTQEFYAQGDEERALGLNVSALCDRAELNNLPKSQKGFLEFVVLPLCNLMGESQGEQDGHPGAEEPDSEQHRVSQTAFQHHRRRFSSITSETEFNIDRMCAGLLRENSTRWQTDTSVLETIKAALGSGAPSFKDGNVNGSIDNEDNGVPVDAKSTIVV